MLQLLRLGYLAGRKRFVPALPANYHHTMNPAMRPFAADGERAGAPGMGVRAPRGCCTMARVSCGVPMRCRVLHRHVLGWSVLRPKRPG